MSESFIKVPSGTPTGTPATPVVAAVAYQPIRMISVTNGQVTRRVPVLAGPPPEGFKLGVIRGPRKKKQRHRVIPNRRRR